MATITPRSIPSLATVVDGTAQMTLGANYTAGSGQFTLSTAPGWTASPALPLTVSIVQKATYAQGPAEVCTTYAVTAVAGAVCTIGSVIAGTDRNYVAGDFVESRVGAAAVNGPVRILDYSASTPGAVLTSTGPATPPTWQTPASGGGGTVMGFSFTAANGFGGSVSNSTVAPNLTLQATATGLLKGAGGGLVAATAGTDYQAPWTLTTNGSSGAATWGGNVLNIPQYAGGSGGGGAGAVLQGLMINGTQQANSAATLDLTTGATTVKGTFAIAGNRLQAGSIAHLVAAGYFDTTGTPGLGMRVYLDGPAGIMLAAPAPGAPAMAGNLSGAIWSLDAWIVCHAAGASGLLSCWGAVRCLGGSAGQSDVTYLLKNVGAEGPPAPVDTTAAHTLTVAGTFSVAATGNTVALRDFAWWLEGAAS